MRTLAQRLVERSGFETLFQRVLDRLTQAVQLAIIDFIEFRDYNGSYSRQTHPYI